MGEHTRNIQLDKDMELHPEVKIIKLLLEIGNTIDKEIQPQKKVQSITP